MLSYTCLHVHLYASMRNKVFRHGDLFHAHIACSFYGTCARLMLLHLLVIVVLAQSGACFRRERR